MYLLTQLSQVEKRRKLYFQLHPHALYVLDIREDAEDAYHH